MYVALVVDLPGHVERVGQRDQDLVVLADLLGGQDRGLGLLVALVGELQLSQRLVEDAQVLLELLLDLQDLLRRQALQGDLLLGHQMELL